MLIVWLSSRTSDPVSAEMIPPALLNDPPQLPVSWRIPPLLARSSPVLTNERPELGGSIRSVWPVELASTRPAFCTHNVLLQMFPQPSIVLPLFTSVPAPAIIGVPTPVVDSVTVPT